MKKVEVIDITPEKFLCPMGDCPAVLKTDTHSYLVIGKILDHSHPAVAGRIGCDETVVEIPADLLEAAIATQIRDR